MDKISEKLEEIKIDINNILGFLLMIEKNLELSNISKTTVYKAGENIDNGDLVTIKDGIAYKAII